MNADSVLSYVPECEECRLLLEHDCDQPTLAAAALAVESEWLRCAQLAGADQTPLVEDLALEVSNTLGDQFSRQQLAELVDCVTEWHSCGAAYNRAEQLPGSVAQLLAQLDAAQISWSIEHTGGGVQNLCIYPLGHQSLWFLMVADVSQFTAGWSRPEHGWYPGWQINGPELGQRWSEWVGNWSDDNAGYYYWQNWETEHQWCSPAEGATASQWVAAITRAVDQFRRAHTEWLRSESDVISCAGRAQFRVTESGEVLDAGFMPDRGAQWMREEGGSSADGYALVHRYLEAGGQLEWAEDGLEVVR